MKGFTQLFNGFKNTQQNRLLRRSTGVLFSDVSVCLMHLAVINKYQIESQNLPLRDLEIMLTELKNELKSLDKQMVSRQRDQSGIQKGITIVRNALEEIARRQQPIVSQVFDDKSAENHLHMSLNMLSDGIARINKGMSLLRADGQLRKSVKVSPEARPSPDKPKPF